LTITRVHVTVNASNAEAVADTMWMAGAAGIEELEANHASGPIVLIGAFADPLAAQAIAERWSGNLECVDDASGLDEWRRYATRVSAGKWTVVPAWLVVPADHDNPACIAIDPGRTFGSGSHVSTQLLLEQIDEIVGPGDSVIDLGCGSGVLSIAAARSGASTVVPVDIDPNSAEVTESNVELNSVSHIVGPVVAAVPQGLTADVVIANMLARDITPLLATVNSALSIGSKFATAGHLINQRDGIVSRCGQLSVTSTGFRGDWSVLTFSKLATQP